ncbi:MAG: TonB C-terminal domain-containing protein [Proteobacteria bacterium]|uniref:TonB C-terminal domain-containing protein n=1 Tax=Aquabacterium sp. TaxID=1872578 RepID=UPI0035C675ED|nr:TonB C-terminal domain-containing protein [Pseudomonadota bacterium]
MAATDTDRGAPEGGVKRFFVPALLVLALVAGGFLVRSMMGKGGDGPKRQNVKIAVLPDTPPPPPPPPKEEKKPEPKPEENKPQPQEQKPVEAPPEPQQLKMEGAAGDGPSAFSAGTVSKEYEKGAIGSGGGGTVGDRLAASSYGNAAKRELQAHLNREDGLRRAGDYKVPMALWLRADGTVERFELLSTSGNHDTDELLRKAMTRFQGFRNPPPSNMVWPMRLQLTNRMSG